MATPSRSRRDFAALEARRFQAARLFAKGESQGAVARALGVTPVTAHHWYHAWHLRSALPNASFIGFTGTPIELTDRNTRAVFGDYIDVYDIQRAVNDGNTDERGVRSEEHT